jgi:ABC-type transport system involved in multi-copper enzyme maturation permease subunit
MMAHVPTLLGGLLNSLTIHVEPWVTNWLTPVWILGLGALLGVLVVLLLCGLGWGLSRIPALARINESRNARLIAGSVLAVLLLGAWSPWLAGQVPANGLTDILWTFGPAAVACFIAGVALVTLTSRRTMEELPLLFQEGPLFWISVTIGAFALFGILGTVVVRDPEAMLDSLRRWPELGRSSQTFVVKAAEGNRFDEAPEEPLTVDWRKGELRSLQFESNESLRISAFPSEEKANAATFDISGGEPLTWKANADPNGPFGDLEDITTLYARNLGDRDAELTITAQTAPATPEMLTVPIIASGVVSLFLMFLVLWGLLPKLSAIAFATAKSEMNTPFYMILTVAGAFLLFLFLWLPYNTFGEDIKMLKFASLDVMLIIALLQTVWSASSSVAEEVEGRTALTVLSKPVGRRDFILGKFLGISWIVMVMFVVFGSVSLLSVAYKPIFDAREGGKAPDRPNVADPLGIVDRVNPVASTAITQDEVNWQICFSEMAATIPAIMLVYFETVVMAAVSVAISTRLALVANFTICFAIYALGHLTPLLVQTSVVAERFEAVIFMGQLIAAVLPVLEYFDVKAAIASGKAVQLGYVGATLVYSALYSAIAMLLGLVLFEDRDLA